MRLFGRKTERRNSGGDFYSTVLRTVELEAATKSADSAATAAVEAAAGLLGRELAQAAVSGSSVVSDALTPTVLRQMGRDLVRPGSTMHRIDTTGGRLRLFPVGQWHWRDGKGADPLTWTVLATEFGPSGTLAYTLPASAVLWIDWAHNASTPWTGKGALDWAALSARTNANAERSLGHETAKAVAQVVALPEPGAPAGTDADGNPETTPSDKLMADIAGAQGKLVSVETTAGGFGKGPADAPQRDWQPAHFGPKPEGGLVELARDAFSRVLSAFGVPPALFVPNADGTAQREALRRYRLNVVEPVARILEAEVRLKLEADVSLRFDPYALDLQARTASLDKLVSAGLSPDAALAIVGLIGETP